VPEVAAFRNALLAGETRKVVYNHPWFWKCAASRTAKPVKSRVSVEPYIMQDSALPESSTGPKEDESKEDESKEDESKEEAEAGPQEVAEAEPE